MKLLLVPLILAGLSASTITSQASESVRPRKSLSFGPVHPHASYSTNPIQVPSFGLTAQSDPLEVASQYASNLIPSHLQGAMSFVLRKDSYTDKATGVTHAYLRQFINGLEVADGDMNVNIKDGVVLSFGDSVRVHQFVIKLQSCSHGVIRLIEENSPLMHHLLPTLTEIIVLESATRLLNVVRMSRDICPVARPSLEEVFRKWSTR